MQGKTYQEDPTAKTAVGCSSTLNIQHRLTYDESSRPKQLGEQ